MEELQTNPVIIVLMFIARCGVPLAIMLGITYLLRRFGLIKGPPPPPAGWDNNQNNQNNHNDRNNHQHNPQDNPQDKPANNHEGRSLV